MEHIPVLLNEILASLNPQPNEDVIDATVNGGGHAEALLSKIAPNGKLLGIDRDPAILAETRLRLARFGGRVMLAEANFANISLIAGEYGVLHPHCILFDLGFSSYHLASANRGFSFQKDEPLDMRYNPKDTDCTAEAIVNHCSPEELLRIFEEYGEIRRAKKFVELLVGERQKRRIQTTKELAALAEKSFGRGKIHPATKVFQALRIVVNRELEHVTTGLAGAFEILEPGGRLAVISFHSLEDRIVKNLFKEWKDAGTILTKKPITASHNEIRQNPRSRSAKLRIITKNS
ncbi:MAG: 16S rRNA (cytosine(1402)-N(4))-methyltransferase [Candidatus Sungbacteria bacterium RIFCSPHIGHO2_02_FULL_49_12]|uniref:Ribosomal RNA small subunit methyltransferase H n=1 Tax=Candidatus Sungbacteria bacterium RIFCSPHIGHO2_02_FULL_49_12 TaxID=1802271 RepID=A0A1G2KSM1_9BACT|nr:MAG: 16S rRNA (cytosine(1402)-N(4))-methyltransferase [Candidatus Sungbacteria bacterium RIFCSPHIGHO2_02_FULL_49_12]